MRKMQVRAFSETYSQWHRLTIAVWRRTIKRVARYCSTDCQRLAWKSHKKTCRENPFVSGDTPEMNDNIESITRFADVWRNSIQAWALFALDLANIREEYLNEHVYVSLQYCVE